MCSLNGIASLTTEGDSRTLQGSRRQQFGFKHDFYSIFLIHKCRRYLKQGWKVAQLSLDAISEHSSIFHVWSQKTSLGSVELLIMNLGISIRLSKLRIEKCVPKINPLQPSTHTRGPTCEKQQQCSRFCFCTPPAFCFLEFSPLELKLSTQCHSARGKFMV